MADSTTKIPGREEGPLAHGPVLHTRPSKPVNSDINVTPLIDVVLVLLIIFMVLTPILLEEMAVNLPDKTEVVEEQEMPEQQLVAAACADGTYVLNRAKMPLLTMQAELARRLRSRNPRIVFVDAHPDVDYSSVVDLIDSVRAAGAEKVGMATLKTADEFLACNDTYAFNPDGTGGQARVGGAPIILGNLDETSVVPVIDSHINQLGECYRNELSKQPDLAGLITIQFTISKTGAVSNAEAKSSTMGNATVETCVASRVRSFEFPQPSGGEAIVTYPFVFSPG